MLQKETIEARFLKALLFAGKILFIESKIEVSFFPAAEPGEKEVFSLKSFSRSANLHPLLNALQLKESSLCACIEVGISGVLGSNLFFEEFVLREISKELAQLARDCIEFFRSIQGCPKLKSLKKLLDFVIRGILNFFNLKHIIVKPILNCVFHVTIKWPTIEFL